MGDAYSCVLSGDCDQLVNMPLKFFSEERAVVIFMYWFGNEKAGRPCRKIEIGHEGRNTGLHIRSCKVREQSKSSSCLFTFHPNGPDCVSRPKAVILRNCATRCNTVTLFDVIRTVCSNDLDVPQVTHFRCARINRYSLLIQ